MKKQWQKRSNENMTYYRLASAKHKTEFITKKEMTVESLNTLSSAGGYHGTDWGDIVEVIMSKTRTWPDDSVDLPPGAYRLRGGDDLPMRLEAMDVRDENYTPVEDSGPLVSDIGKFLNSKEIFEKFNFSYRRGYLLYGEPGTGKTAFIRNLVQKKEFESAYIIWVNFVPPPTMVKALNAIAGMKVIIMEELIEEHGGLSYPMKHLLEFLDGETSIKNCITIATTNYPEFLHKNLADRPSRFDVIFEMKRQSEAVIKPIMEQWLEREVKPGEFDFSNFTLAQIKEICLLHRFHAITLREAADKLKKQGEKFKNNFADKKGLGLGIGMDD